MQMERYNITSDFSSIELILMKTSLICVTLAEVPLLVFATDYIGSNNGRCMVLHWYFIKPQSQCTSHNNVSMVSCSGRTERSFLQKLFVNVSLRILAPPTSMYTFELINLTHQMHWSPNVVICNGWEKLHILRCVCEYMCESRVILRNGGTEFVELVGLK